MILLLDLIVEMVGRASRAKCSSYIKLWGAVECIVIWLHVVTDHMTSCCLFRYSYNRMTPWSDTALPATLGQKWFVLAHPFYRAGGRSWRPPAQKDKGPLGQCSPAQKQSVLAGHLTGCQQRWSHLCWRSVMWPASTDSFCASGCTMWPANTKLRLKLRELLLLQIAFSLDCAREEFGYNSKITKYKGEGFVLEFLGGGDSRR